MANVDAAFGLRPYKGLNPASAVPSANKYLINPNNNPINIRDKLCQIFRNNKNFFFLSLKNKLFTRIFY